MEFVYKYLYQYYQMFFSLFEKMNILEQYFLNLLTRLYYF